MKQITKILQALQANQMSAAEAESQILKLIPSNPMDIQDYVELWSDPKNDYDLAFRAGMKGMHELAIDLLNAEA